MLNVSRIHHQSENINSRLNLNIKKMPLVDEKPIIKIESLLDDVYDRTLKDCKKSKSLRDDIVYHTLHKEFLHLRAVSKYSKDKRKDLSNEEIAGTMKSTLNCFFEKFNFDAYSFNYFKYYLNVVPPLYIKTFVKNSIICLNNFKNVEEYAKKFLEYVSSDKKIMPNDLMVDFNKYTKEICPDTPVLFKKSLLFRTVTKAKGKLLNQGNFSDYVDFLKDIENYDDFHELDIYLKSVNDDFGSPVAYCLDNNTFYYFKPYFKDGEYKLALYFPNQADDDFKNYFLQYLND